MHKEERCNPKLEIAGNYPAGKNENESEGTDPGRRDLQGQKETNKSRCFEVDVLSAKYGEDPSISVSKASS